MNNAPLDIDDAVAQALRSNDGISALLKLTWTGHTELDRRQVERVQRSLRTVAQHRDAYIRQKCTSQSQSISTALQNLEMFQAGTAQVRERGQDVILRLQRRHDECEARVLAYEKMCSARQRLVEAQNKLQEVTQMVYDVQEVMENLEGGNLYHAACLLSKLHAQLSSDIRSFSGQTNDANSNSNSNAHELWLSKELSLHVEHLFTGLNQRLSAELNSWLTDSRAMAPRIGRTAILAIQEERRKKILWAKQRAALLAGVSDDDALSIINSSSTNSQYRDVVDPYRELDMSSLLLCVHVHTLMHDTANSQLLSEYVEGRTSQLSTDLAPPKDLMTCYQAYLWHILGYFVVEMRVFAMVPHLGTQEHMEAAWEGASAALAAELVAALDEIKSVDEYIALKDHALLFCDAIDEYCTDDNGMASLSSSKVRVVFEVRRQTFLMSLVRDSIVDKVSNVVRDPHTTILKPVVEDVYEAFYKACSRVDGPTVASDTDNVAVHTAFSDCEATFANALAEVHAVCLMNTAELYEEEKEKEKEKNDNSSESEDPVLNQLISMLAAANIVKSSLEALRTRLFFNGDEQRSNGGYLGLEAHCPSPIVFMPQVDGAVATVEEALARRLYTAVRPAVEAYKLVEWNSHSVPRTGGNPTGQCNEILEVLGAVNDVLKANIHISTASRHQTLLSSVNHIAEGITNILASDAYVPAYTVFGIQYLLSDLNALSSFAENVVSEGDDNNGDVQKVEKECDAASSLKAPHETEIVKKLREIVLLCQLLAFNNVEELLDDDMRGEKYTDLNLERTVLLLEKLSDVPAPATSEHSLTREKALHVAAVLRGNVGR